MKMSKRQRRQIAQAFSLVTQLSINIIVCIGAGFFIGKILDSFFSTSPVFLIIFVIFGIGAAFKNVYRLCVNIFKK